MTTKTRTITIQAFRDPSGLPTCSVGLGDNQTCQFLLWRSMGLQPVCGFGEQRDLYRRDEYGFVAPHDECVLWKDEK